MKPARLYIYPWQGCQVSPMFILFWRHCPVIYCFFSLIFSILAKSHAFASWKVGTTALMAITVFLTPHIVHLLLKEFEKQTKSHKFNLDHWSMKGWSQMNPVLRTCTHSRCIKDLLVTLCCCLFYGWVVVSLIQSPFPFSILLSLN